jgi:predicted  nucleic acid-binding Zn-ribbon protein
VSGAQELDQATVDRHMQQLLALPAEIEKRDRIIRAMREVIRGQKKSEMIFKLATENGQLKKRNAKLAAEVAHLQEIVNRGTP